MSYHKTIGLVQVGHIDYLIGDRLMNDDGKFVGICTGFTHDDTCVLINGKCYGGKFYFHKCDYEETEIIEIIKN